MENSFPCRKCGTILAPTIHEARKCPKCKVWTFKPTGRTKAEEEGRMKTELGVCAWDPRPHPKGIHNPGARSERDFDCKDWVSGFVAEKLTDLELSPCPFCGSTDLELDNIRQEDDFFVSCNNCEVQQIANYTRLEAVRRWNMRPASSKAARAPGGQGTRAKIFSSTEIAQQLANVGGFDRWVPILDKWLASHIDSWKAEERIWNAPAAEAPGWPDCCHGSAYSKCRCAELAAPAAPSERDEAEIPWDKLKPLMNVVCDGYGISHYPEEAPGDFDFCEGSIAWLAVEAYRIGRAGLSSQEGK